MVYAAWYPMGPDLIDSRAPAASGVTAEPLAAMRRSSGRDRSRAWVIALMLWDALLAAVVFALMQTGGEGSGGEGPAVAAAGAAAFVPIASAAMGGYDLRGPAFGPGTAVFGRMLLLALAAGGLAWMVVDATGGVIASDRLAMGTFAVAALWTAARLFAGGAWRLRPERVLIVGTGHTARSLLALTRRHPEQGLSVVGFIDDDPLPLAVGAPPVLGGLGSLPGAVAQNDVDRIVVSFGGSSDADVLQALRQCDGLGVEIDVVPRMFNLVGRSPPVRSIGGMPLIRVRPLAPRPGEGPAKRAFDMVVAGALLLLAAPLLVGIAAAILLVDGRPIVFRQTRVGREGRDFLMLKFRTMSPEREPAKGRFGNLLSQHPTVGAAFDEMKREGLLRVTPLGRFLRRTSLDELPQLVNVLRGDMSLVGPRPLPTYEAETLSGWQLTRQATRPGITGLWQVLGRSDVEWNERMQLDYDYVRHWSLAQDVRILAETVRAVCSRRGAL